MLAVLFGTTTITMNRGEQETLYRQARNLRLHQESKAQHNSSQTLSSKPRHHSYGNIHQIHSTTSVNIYKQGMNYRSVFGTEQGPLNATACDDLVLSVLKSPIRDQSLVSNLSGNSECAGGSVNRLSAVTTLTTASDNAPGPQGIGRTYATLQASEDDLADDVELGATETTELNNDADDQFNNPDPYGLKFLRRFRTPKLEPPHKRVPTPMRRKHTRDRSRSTADILDDVNQPNADEPDEEVAIQNGAAEGVGGGGKAKHSLTLI